MDDRYQAILIVFIKTKGEKRGLLSDVSDLMYRKMRSHRPDFFCNTKLNISTFEIICIKVMVLRFSYLKSLLKTNVTYISVRLIDLFGEGDVLPPETSAV